MYFQTASWPTVYICMTLRIMKMKTACRNELNFMCLTSDFVVGRWWKRKLSEFWRWFWHSILEIQCDSGSLRCSVSVTFFVYSTENLRDFGTVLTDMVFTLYLGFWVFSDYHIPSTIVNNILLLKFVNCNLNLVDLTGGIAKGDS